MMRTLLFTISFLATSAAGAQDSAKRLKGRIVVKTNVLSLLAHRPTLALEKVFSPTFSTEASFVWGNFQNILFTDYYGYHGFLLRAKKHFSALERGAGSFYGGAYAGTLKRTIYTQGQTDRTGWFGYPSRDFQAHSIRGGASLGFNQFFRSKVVLDVQTSLGYGRYLNLDKTDPNTYSRGYLDAQLWLSVGYCF